jgi:hypothetical protein
MDGSALQQAIALPDTFLPPDACCRGIIIGAIVFNILT